VGGGRRGHLARRHAVAAMSAFGHVAFLIWTDIAPGQVAVGDFAVPQEEPPLTPTARAFTYLGAMVACALLPACTPTAVSTTPTPGVSTPVGQSTPPETDQQRKERLDFEAAEKAYRTFAAEYDRLYEIKDGPIKPTKKLTDNASGPYLKVMLGFLQDSRRRGHHTEGRVRIAYVERGAYSTSELILNTCEDGSGVRVLDKNGKQVATGGTSKLTLYVHPVGGRWKVWDGDQEVVKACAA
jgi:hypothetical protein